MKNHFEKEVEPIVYDSSAVRILSFSMIENQKPFPKHWHERMEFHIVKSGTLKLICDEVEVLIHPGEISIISPGVSHTGGALDGTLEYDVIMFEPEYLINGFISSQQYIRPLVDEEFRFVYKTNIPQILSLANQIIEMHKNKNSYNPLENIACIYQFLGLLHRYCVTYDKQFSPIKTRISDVIKYIDSNFTNNLDLDYICKEFYYEKSTFCRCFKKHTGLKYSEYIRLKRLEYSCKLLKKTEYTIKDIAVQAGFNDSAYFVNCFKKNYGMTPLHYRNIYVEQKPSPEIP